MGKALDALLGRNFKTSKFKTLVNLASTRVERLKNQHQGRWSQARSDAIQLLNCGQHDRALLRVEYVIKERNMLDVLVMIEGYFHILIERLVLIENNKNKECPSEIKEAVASLIFATSRIGEFPELQEIRSIFVSRYGKEFASHADAIRPNCGVNTALIQKLSTRHPCLDSKIKLLGEIAAEIGVTLHLEVEKPEEKKEWIPYQKSPQASAARSTDTTTAPKDQPDDANGERDEEIEAKYSRPTRRKKNYSSVASAVQAAAESAAIAASAARAAIALSRKEHGSLDRLNSNAARRRRANRSRSPRARHPGRSRLSEKTRPADDFSFDNVHPTEVSESESDFKRRSRHYGKERTRKRQLQRSLSDSSLDSSVDSFPDGLVSFNYVRSKSKPPEQFIYYESDYMTGYSQSPSFRHYGVPIIEFPKSIQTNVAIDSEEEFDRRRLGAQMSPVNAMSRRTYGD